MNADLIYHEFGWDALVRTPGHQEIEIGLVKLCRATGNKKYFDLARFFLDARGPDGQKQKYKWRIPGGNINPLPPLE